MDMPLEIVAGICEQLLECSTDLPPPPPRVWQSTLQDFPALGNLALTCRDLQELLSPLLYQRLKVAIANNAAITGLIKRFSRHPDYGCHVRSVLILGAYPPGAAIPSSQLDSILSERSRRRMRQLTSTGRKRFVPSLLIYVLLKQVPNIRKLVICVPKSVDPRLDLDYGSFLPGSFSLRFLRSLEIHSRGVNSGVEMPKRPLTALLRHTLALTSLVVGRCVKGNHGIVESPLPKLRHLYLAQPHPQDVVDIARWCPRLESCHIGYRDLAPPEPVHLMPASFQTFVLGPLPQVPPLTIDCALESLVPLSATLQTLSLHWNVGMYPVFPTGSLGLISRFLALKSLHLFIRIWPHKREDTIIFITKLPSGIESLTLGGFNIPLYDLVSSLSDRVRNGQLPALKCFRHRLLNLYWEADFEDSEDSEQSESEGVDSLLTLESIKVGSYFDGTGVECQAW